LQKPASASGLLVDLVQTELRGPKSADALILLGPRSAIRDDIPPEALDKFPAAIPGLFYLQFQPRLPLRAGQMPGPLGRNGGPPSMGRPSLAGQAADGSATRGAATSPGWPDSIEKLVGRLKGKTIPVLTPHDFTDAIRRIDAATGRTSVPGELYEGDTRLDGRRLMDYSFSVPREESRYRVKAQKEWVIAGYTGRLLVDPQTAGLVRLAVRTQELPAETHACETDTTMEYGLVQLGGGDYLLPKATRQRFIGRDGSEAQNSVAFSACREYQAESKLTFHPGVEPGGATRGGVQGTAWDLPTGLPVTVELMAAIQGDRVAARRDFLVGWGKQVRRRRYRQCSAQRTDQHGHVWGIPDGRI
jgi:hypothetical protein